MGMTIDDNAIEGNAKQKLINKLLEEPPMVLMTAYIYAKNYVAYGEDVTKAWTTAVQQASILERARQQAWVEAYDRFKADYENRLKADMVAMLTEIQLEIREYHEIGCDEDCNHCRLMGCVEPVNVIKDLDIIQQKINSLKAEIEPQESENKE